MHVWADSFELYASGRKAPLGSLKDARLLAAFERYRRTIAKRYRSIEPAAMERILPAGKLWISTQVDGELWFLVKREGQVALTTYNGRVLQGLPIDTEATKLLEGRGDMIIAGELFAVPQGQGRARVQHVAKALSEPGLVDSLSFRAFDLVEEGSEDGLLLPYEQRMERLDRIFAKGVKAKVVTTVVGDVKDAASYYREWVGTQQFEGIVVRTEQGLTFKVKPTFTLDAVVIAFGERIVNGVSQLRELSVALRRDDGDLQFLGTVGNGFSEEGRIEWLARLSKMEMPSSFRMANREGTLCRFVRPDIVIEIQVSDLLETDADDRIIHRVALRYDPEMGYASRGDHPIPAMLFPVFLRERTDKTADVTSIGMQQITSRLPIHADDVVASFGEPPPSKVMRRQVFAKENKGQTAVRKYVVLETGKTATREYPPYALFFTDFSAGRAEPLKTSVRTASTLDHVQAQIAEWLEENVKRGWIEVGTVLPEQPAAPAIAALPADAPSEAKKPATRKKPKADEAAE